MVAEGTQQQYTNWYYQQQQQQYFAETSCAAAEPSPMHLWPSYGQPTYLQYQSHHAAVYQQQQMQLAVGAQSQQQQPIGWAGEEAKSHDNNGIFNSEPSSAGTSSGSEIGSPGTPASPIEQTRPMPTRSPFEWMKKNNYDPTPGKTRTKDKYRVVYTEHQRLELEKEFYSSKYITTVRKAELAAAVALSERQIKIWFQNRRAKERRKSEKRGDLEQRDIKPILDAHGVAHAPPTSAPPPLIGMANLSLGHTSMSSLTNDLPPLSSYPSALMSYHHHPRLGVPVAPTTHHPQPPAIGTWADNSVAM